MYCRVVLFSLILLKENFSAIPLADQGTRSPQKDKTWSFFEKVIPLHRGKIPLRWLQHTSVLLECLGDHWCGRHAPQLGQGRFHCLQRGRRWSGQMYCSERPQGPSLLPTDWSLWASPEITQPLTWWVGSWPPFRKSRGSWKGWWESWGWTLDHRRGIYTEEKAKIVAAVWGMYTWMPHYPFSSKDDLKKIFRKNIRFGRVVVFVWCEVEDHPFFRSIHSTKCPFFYSSISSNHPVMRQGLE